MINFLKQWYEMWKYNCIEQSYISKWNLMAIIYAYKEVKEEMKNESE
jgi:hypothetical protein